MKPLQLIFLCINTMKFYSAVLVLCLAVLIQAESELREKAKKLSGECQKETNAPADLVEKLNHGQYTGDGKDLNCYTKCFFLKAGFMDDKGEVNVDAMKKMVEDDPKKAQLDAIIDKCEGLKGTDACETSFLLYKCFKDDYNKL